MNKQALKEEIFKDQVLQEYIHTDKLIGLIDRLEVPKISDDVKAQLIDIRELLGNVLHHPSDLKEKELNIESAFKLIDDILKDEKGQDE